MSEDAFEFSELWGVFETSRLGYLEMRRDESDPEMVEKAIRAGVRGIQKYLIEKRAAEERNAEREVLPRSEPVLLDALKLLRCLWKLRRKAERVLAPDVDVETYRMVGMAFLELGDASGPTLEKVAFSYEEVQDYGDGVLNDLLRLCERSLRVWKCLGDDCKQWRAEWVMKFLPSLSEDIGSLLERVSSRTGLYFEGEG